jgi:hypothetical protein
VTLQVLPHSPPGNTPQVSPTYWAGRDASTIKPIPQSHQTVRPVPACTRVAGGGAWGTGLTWVKVASLVEQAHRTGSHSAWGGDAIACRRHQSSGSSNTSQHGKCHAACAAAAANRFLHHCTAPASADHPMHPPGFVTQPAVVPAAEAHCTSPAVLVLAALTVPAGQSLQGSGFSPKVTFVAPNWESSHFWARQVLVVLEK